MPNNCNYSRKKKILIACNFLFITLNLWLFLGPSPHFRESYQNRPPDFVLHYNINNFTDIVLQNSDELPTKSHFGTTNFKNICQAEDAKLCVGKFKFSVSALRYSTRYKIMNCLIQKSLSTINQGIMCFLYDEENAKKNNAKDKPLGEIAKWCNDKNNVDMIGDPLDAFEYISKRENVTNNWSMLALVREPINRFFSGFVDKCIRFARWETNYCNGCKANLTCFILTEYERLMNYNKNWNAYTFDDQHFLPQQWRCGFDHLKNNYTIIRYDDNDYSDGILLRKQIGSFLTRNHVKQSSIQLILDKLNEKTDHRTKNTVTRNFIEDRLYKSPFLIEFLVRMFYWDFVLFGYPLPNIQFNDTRSQIKK